MNAYTLNTRSIAAACFAVMIVMFASAALPHLVFAQDDGDYGDDGGDYYSDDSGCCDYGSVDTYPDSSDYGSVDTYPDDYDYGSVDTYPDSSDYGSVDTYPDSSDYGSVDTYSDDYGSVDTYPDTTDYDSSTPEYTEDEYGTDEYGTDEYGTDEYGTDEYGTDEYGSTPSYGYSQPLAISAPGYSTGGYSIGGYSTGGGYYSTPSIPYAPPVQNIPIAYNQPSQPSVITTTNNTCTNGSCNYTDNSINDSYNTAISNSGNTVTTIVPVAQAPVSYPVQYTFPQQPVYQQPTYYNNYQNVSCTISASPNSIQSGQYTYLTWQSSGATEATLTSYGNVGPNGSLSVQPYGSTSYVLTVYGQNGQTSTCNTDVAVGSAYPSVSLSQIPYTGFDFGEMGDAMYWALLTLFALAAGYLLVYYKGGMGAFAGAVIPMRRRKVSVAPVKTTSVAQTVVEKKETPTAAFTADRPIVEKRVETPAPAKAPAALGSLPVVSNARPTNDSMTIATHDGAPRIVISRN